MPPERARGGPGEDVALDVTIADDGNSGKAAVGNRTLEVGKADTDGGIVLDLHEFADA